MKNIKLLLMLAAMFVAVGLVFTSCSDDDDPVNATLQVAPSADRTVDYQGTTTAWTYTVTVSPENLTWNATSSAAWATIEDGTKSGNGTFKVSVAEYPEAEADGNREATITVKANGATDVTFKITQTPYEVTLSAAPKTHNFSDEGGSVDITVTTNADEWTWVKSGDWFNVTKNGDVLTVTASENTGAANSGTITISAEGATDEVVNLTQSAENTDRFKLTGNYSSRAYNLRSGSQQNEIGYSTWTNSIATTSTTNEYKIDNFDPYWSQVVAYVEWSLEYETYTFNGRTSTPNGKVGIRYQDGSTAELDYYQAVMAHPVDQDLDDEETMISLLTDAATLELEVNSTGTGWSIPKQTRTVGDKGECYVYVGPIIITGASSFQPLNMITEYTATKTTRSSYMPSGNNYSNHVSIDRELTVNEQMSMSPAKLNIDFVAIK